jgi:hypothetical protein
MANYIFTGVGAGKIGQYVQNVIDNSPANSAIIWVPMLTSGTAEQAEGLATMALVESDANFSEQTTGGWARITHDDAGDSLAYTHDTTNNRNEADSADLVWASPSTNTVGLIACYDPDTTAGTDTTLIPLVHLDMVVTGNSQQVTFQFNAEGWFNATRA